MIDRQTIDKIMEAANIVEVVSEFVTLRKSGSNYKGLCPFHNERTPSFVVSPARNTCHCFGCGQGGNPVNFIMEHEQMTYPEALRWLANKYHIEIRERERTDEEREADNKRESMFIVNEWVAKYFEDLLHNNADGQAIGMQYFRSRGIRDDIIKKFRLGYDLANGYALPQAAVNSGYKEEYLLSTGICYKREKDGKIIDRYAGRVMFPWIGMNGKVVGFGGRKLDAATKGVQQKYVNSPDSEIYHKDQQLYGIYQAKKAIAREDCVYMVEGYTDVIAMHQCGIENVVANSGTALSIHQIRMLHRFTNNIVLLYDGDAAGIHAAMRGTDMLLAEGMNIKVLLLPDGDDPDSFARKHTAEDFKRYIAEHQTDFIRFKTQLMLRGVTDPIKRSEAINSIVQSIAVITDPVVRATYLSDCAQLTGINEMTLITQMNKMIRAGKEGGSSQNSTSSQDSISSPTNDSSLTISPIDRMIGELVVKYGERIILRNVDNGEGGTMNVSVAQFIKLNLDADDLRLESDNIWKILNEAAGHAEEKDWKAESYFLQHKNIEISRLAQQLSTDKVQLSERLQMNYSDEELYEKTQHVLLDFRMKYVTDHLHNLEIQIKQNANNPAKTQELMQEYMEMKQIQKELAKAIGIKVV
ncbi:MAG: DNA primase [Prevotella sp.]|nr:DNA primase [Prevotella sp.]